MKRDQILLEKDQQVILEEFPEAIKDAGLPGKSSMELVNPSRQGRIYLSVKIPNGEEDRSLVDGENAGVELEEDILQAVPSFVSRMFERSSRVQQIRIALQVNSIDDTGHECQKTIQSFEFQRSRWERLRTGVYSNDWKMLLSKSSPSPGFPGNESFSLQKMLRSTVFLVVAFGLGFLVALNLLKKFLGR